MHILLDGMFNKRAATIAFDILSNDETNIKVNVEVQSVAFLIRVIGILTGWDISQFCSQSQLLKACLEFRPSSPNDLAEDTR